MNARMLYRRLLPQGVRTRVRKLLDELITESKAPRMVMGYRDASGELRPRTRLSDTVFLYHRERINIADNAFVWHYTILDGTGGLTIGEGAQIGAWVGIFTHSSHISIRLYGRHYQDVHEDEKKGYVKSPVSIGPYTFVGAGSLILPGVTIGKGALVSAGSIVTRAVKDFEVVSGNPAEVVGDTRVLDKRCLRDPQLQGWYDEWQH